MPEAHTKSRRPASRRNNTGRSAQNRPVSLSEQAYEAIKESIVTLTFTPGQYLNEAAICSRLRLGRTPVHQALQRLQIEGLVEIVPRKGIIVQPDTLGRVMEMLDARAVIEPELARRAAANATQSDVSFLESVLDRSRCNPPVATQTLGECDRAFHAKIADMSGNQMLGGFLKSLHERSSRFWCLHLWQTLDPAGSDKQHRAVLEAIRMRDGEGAAKAMQAHNERLRERLVEIRNAAPRAGIYPLHL